MNIGGEWKERYGIVNEIKEDEIVWTTRFAGHDGCCWTYSWKFGIRLTTPQGSKRKMMNENETFQGCQYIALFMGWKPDDIRIYLTLKAPNIGKLAFNESMDLLMPVIEKIESLPAKEEGEQYQFNITGDGISITRYDDGSGIIAERVNEIGKSKTQSSFEVIATFCKEYLTPRHDK